MFSAGNEAKKSVPDRIVGHPMDGVEAMAGVQNLERRIGYGLRGPLSGDGLHRGVRGGHARLPEAGLRNSRKNEMGHG